MVFYDEPKYNFETSFNSSKPKNTSVSLLNSYNVIENDHDLWKTIFTLTIRGNVDKSSTKEHRFRIDAANIILVIVS